MADRMSKEEIKALNERIAEKVRLEFIEEARKEQKRKDRDREHAEALGRLGRNRSGSGYLQTFAGSGGGCR
jgi:hypothetical protein